MTQPSFADELRAAATALRTAADAAQAASPLPWTAGDDEGPPIPYIALMHPGVGHALADLLDRQGRIAREVQDHLGAEFQDGALDQNVHDALAVARDINGSQP